MCVLNLDFVDSDRDRVDTNDDDGEEIDDKDDDLHFSFLKKLSFVIDEPKEDAEVE